MTSWTSREGSPLPFGACYLPEEDAYNFALYSKHATAVRLLLYSGEEYTQPVYTFSFDPLVNKTHRVWHCRIGAAELKDARYYAYRVDGPEPEGGYEWHLFDPDNLLLDPYAREVFFPPGFDRRAARRPGPNDGQAPLAVLPPPEAEAAPVAHQRPRHEHDLIIYELHVRGFTQHPSSGVAPEKRGTFAGLVEKIPYLLELGVTAIELMPIHQFDPQTDEYWGYNTLNFFSLHHAYAEAGTPEGKLAEFRRLVRELHRAGIEVLLDVVYNHTAEGDRGGPTYSFKGIDNSTYYLLDPGQPENPYCDYSGTGNTLHTRNVTVRTLIVDSLRYWAGRMLVDGFRFDLASVFTRDSDGNISFDDPPIFGEVRTHEELRDARLIAEPWDTEVYQLGNRFPGAYWMQWNGAFRDDVRRFVRGDGGLVGALIQRLYGSDDFFPDDLLHAYHAYQSVNFVTAHDGFTLYDLVAYNHKHNEANGLDNRDGADENYSWNCGHEGEAGAPPEVEALRRRQARNFCTLLFLANGTPMFVMGDEFLRTQRGNNNAFNQDNEISWVDWDRLEANRPFFEFFKKMIAFRKAHPSLGRSRFWRDDVRWYAHTGGPADLSPASRTLAFFLGGHSQQDDDLYVLINGHWEGHTFTIAEPGPWRRIINTGIDDASNFLEPGQEILPGKTYWMGPRSVAVLSRGR